MRITKILTTLMIITFTAIYCIGDLGEDFTNASGKGTDNCFSISSSTGIIVDGNSGEWASDDFEAGDSIDDTGGNDEFDFVSLRLAYDGSTFYYLITMNSAPVLDLSYTMFFNSDAGVDSLVMTQTISVWSSLLASDSSTPAILAIGNEIEGEINTLDVNGFSEKFYISLQSLYDTLGPICIIRP